MELFHVAFKEYKVGEVIEFKDQKTEYLDWVKSRGNGWVEDLLESARPKAAPQRGSCNYMCEQIVHCYAFSEYDWRKLNGEIPRFYSVDAIDVWKAPMALPELIRKKGPGNPVSLKIANEYWFQTKKWSYLEILSKKMIITGKLANPVMSFPFTGYDDLGDDANEAERIWET
jgi:hypothetical protein